MDETALAKALGLKSAYGFHVEEGPRLPFTVPIREQSSTRWYPCIKTNHTYTGCLGMTCPLEVCWTDTASPSYTAALRLHFHPTDAEYVARARCLWCRYVEEIAIAAIDGRRGLIHLLMLRCMNQCWQSPISASAFVRRRIPPQDDHDLAHCPLFEQASMPIPIVERYRLHLNDRVRARRATGEARGGQHG